MSHPLFVAHTSDVHVDAEIACSLLVKNTTTGEYSTPFVTKLKILFGAFLVVEKGVIKVQIRDSKINEFSTLKSDIGELHLDKLQDAVNFVFSTVKPAVNQFLNSNGIPLPVLFDIDFGDAIVTLNESFVRLDLNPVFKKSLIHYLLSKRKRNNK